MASQSQDGALYTPGVGTELQLARKPDEVMSEAREIASRLKDIVVQTKAVQKIGESEHLKLEAWQTLGSFYGMTGRIRKTEYVEFGPIAGFKAYADLVHVASGKVVSSAEALCLNDEEKWSERPKYEYHYILKDGTTTTEDPGWNNMQTEPNPNKPGKMRPKKKKVKVGMEKVPMHQLMSMAETRANSKVHSMALRWIVVLAGYAPTPAEETLPASGSDDDEYPGAPEDPGPIHPPQKSSAAGPSNGSAGQAAAAGRKFINQDQINKLWGAGYSPNQHHKVLQKQQIEELIRACGFERSDKIPVEHFDMVYKAVFTGKPPDSDPDPGAGRSVHA